MSHKERSVGIIPLRQDRGRLDALVIQYRAGHWSFPKGHPMPGESDKQTAQRELLEETGLFVVQYFPAPPIQERYSFFRDGRQVQKEAVYFVAEVAGSLRLQEEELMQASWVSLEAAEERMTFPEGKQLVRDVVSLLM